MSATFYLLTFFIVFIVASCVGVFGGYSCYMKDYKQKIAVDISVEQMTKFEGNISAFLKEHRMNTNATIWEIAEALKIKIGEESDKTSNEGALDGPDQKGNMIVTFKSGMSSIQRKFAFAHECAHLINHDDFPVTRPAGQNKAEIEQFADYTAAALLMPLDNVYDVLEENQYRDLSPKNRVKVVRLLCKKYGVSDVLVLRRIKEVYMLKDKTAC